MTGAPRVAARILAPDLPCLWHEVAVAVRSGVDRVHVDVMGSLAADVTVGQLAWRALRRVTQVPFEVHLMVRPDERVIAAFADAGAEAIVFHPEAAEDVGLAVALVKAHGCQAGLALAAGTPLDVLDGLLGELDLVLVTWATPGLDGQRFVPSALRWLRSLRARVATASRPVSISVDGGVLPDTAAELLAAGADALVVEAVPCPSAAGFRVVVNAARPLEPPAPRAGRRPVAS